MKNFEHSNFVFEVLDVKERRIATLKVILRDAKEVKGDEKQYP